MTWRGIVVIQQRYTVLVLLLIVFAASCVADTTHAPPNIVYILADDLGYAELGSYGQQKIKTPNIDRLALEGMRFTQHYSGNTVCAPSRAVLMTGKHPGHAHVRHNRKAELPDELLERYGMDFQGQEAIPDAAVTIAELLQQRGYTTAAIGKWGLGHFGTSGDPNLQGFDLFFGYNDQVHAHSFYPAYLWRNGVKVPLENDPPVPGHANFPQDADPDDPASYAKFKGSDYSGNHMIEEALGFIRENRDGPFFLYFPSTIPHLALHIPDEELEPYLGKWEETPYVREAGKGYTPHMTPRAAYAAMISRLDKDLGRIMQELKSLGLDQNTLVMFSSDNGTSHLRQEVDYEFFDSVGPLRGLKGSLYEGGIRVPMIARWPGKIEASTISSHISAFWDVMPTMAEVAEAKLPEGIDGISFLPTLLGEAETQQVHDFLYWEFTGQGGQQAVRMGDWKAVRQDLLSDDNPEPLKVELYNLGTDIGETTDLASRHPEIVRQMEAIMESEHTPSEIFPLPPLDSSGDPN